MGVVAVGVGVGVVVVVAVVADSSKISREKQKKDCKMIRINKLKQDRCFRQKKHPLIFDGSRWIFTIGPMRGSFFVDHRATQVYKV